MLSMILVVLVLAVFLSFGSLRLFSIRKMEEGEKRDALVLSIVGGKLRQILKICKVELSVDGLDRIPEKEAVLFIGNHRSYFDIVVAYSILPRPTGFISKKEIAKIPNIELWMRELHCLFLDRENLKQNLQVIIEAIKQVKAGISMWIYPEGTRTKGESELELGEFKAGSFKIAEKSGCKIVPVAEREGSQGAFRNDIIGIAEQFRISQGESHGIKRRKGAWIFWRFERNWIYWIGRLYIFSKKE